MSLRDNGAAPSQPPSLRHHCADDEPSPHPEITLFPVPPFARAFKDKDHFVESTSSAVQDELLETTKPALESSINCSPTSPFRPRLIGRQVYSDFTSFRRCGQPFVHACCCGQYCTTPNVYHQNYGSSRRRYRDLPDAASRYYIETTTLADNILLPANFARMAYERERWNLGTSTANDGGVAARKRALLLAGISSEGISGNEARNSNFEINVDRVYAGGGCPSRLVTCQSGFQMENGTFQRVQESSKAIRKFESFCEGDGEDGGNEKRFRAAEPNSTASERDINVESVSWQGFKPVVDKRVDACPNIDSMTTPPCEFPNNVVVSQDEDAALRLQIMKKRVPSSEELSSCHQAQTEASRPRTKDRVCSTELPSTSGTSHARSSSCDTCVGDELSARLPSHESECANKNDAVRSGAPAMDETSGFISLDSTRTAFFTLMNKMRTGSSQHNVMCCPHCSHTFTQYPALRMHVQTAHQSVRTFADHYAAEMPGHKARSAREETGQTQPVPPSLGSPEDEANKLRATSVIKFAGQKKKA